MWIPGDFLVSPRKLTTVLAKEAQTDGALSYHGSLCCTYLDCLHWLIYALYLNFSICLKYAFRALTLLVGRHEEHPACKNIE